MHIKRLDISGVGWLAAGWQTDDYINRRYYIIFIMKVSQKSAYCFT